MKRDSRCTLTIRQEQDSSGRPALCINLSSGVPIYRQLIEQVKYRIATGVLKPHDELPSVRALAGQYLINPNTVMRAYLELERDEVIYKKRSVGTYVAEKDVSMSQEEKFKIVRQLLDKTLVQAAELGLSPVDMQQVFQERLDQFGKEESESI